MNVKLGIYDKCIDAVDFARTEDALKKKVFIANDTSSSNSFKQYVGFRSMPSKKLLEKNKSSLSKIHHAYKVSYSFDNLSLYIQNNASMQWTLNFDNLDEREKWMKQHVHVIEK